MFAHESMTKIREVNPCITANNAENQKQGLWQNTIGEY